MTASYSLEISVVQRIETEAKNTRRSKSSIVQEALDEYFRRAVKRKAPKNNRRKGDSIN